METKDVNPNNNGNNKQKILIGIIIVLVVIIVALLLFRAFGPNASTGTIGSNVANKGISANQTDITDINKKAEETEYTDFVGHGLIEIDKDYPNVYLQNPETNTVYMQFDVTYNDEIIYSSDLVAPGKMEALNIYDLLDSGKHTLVYKISTYDVETKELCMAGINQEQDINITK